MSIDKDLDIVLKRLTKLPVKIQSKVVDKALREATKHVAAAVADEAPVDAHRIKDGVLIRKRRSKNKFFTTFKIGINAKRFYAPFVQFGTSERAADPFFTRAYTRTWSSALGIMKKALKQNVEKEIKKLGK